MFTSDTLNSQLYVLGDKMDKARKLPTDIKWIWRLNAIIDFVILGIITAAFFIWKMTAPVNMKNALGIISIALLVVTIVIFVIELSIVSYHWNFWTYYIDEQYVELHHGYFFRKQIIIPIARIQNVTLKQGPILRLKDLQKIEIVTAAGARDIAGIKTSQADDLKGLIMKLAREARNDL